MRVRFRPSEPSDFIALLGQLPVHRTRGITALAGDELLGIGGLITAPDGSVWASCFISDAGRTFPRAVHRAGLELMRLARSAGCQRVFASAEDRPGAERWLLALGFRRVPEEPLFVWEPS